MMGLVKAMKISHGPWLLLAMSLAAFSPWVPTEAVFAEPSSAQGRGIVKGETKQGFSYISGGIGAEEREQMEKWAKAYNLELSFAVKTGQYLSDVSLTIEDEKGNAIVTTIAQGPWFYIQLPPGRYTVKATFEGQAKEIRDLQLSKDHHVSRVMHWDLSLASKDHR